MMFRALLPGLPQRYGFAGLALGSLLPVAGLAAEYLSGRGGELSAGDPFHAIVYSLPFLFAVLFYLLGRDRARLLIRLSAGEAMERELLHMSLHDRLTGLPNRAALEREASRLTSARSGERLKPAFLLLDLDKFKTVNDTLGHDAGDELLTLFSLRVEAGLGPQERIFRLGGDEFVVVVAGCPDRHELTRVAGLVEACADEPFDVDAGRAVIGVSIGIAIFEAGEGMSDVMKRADVALYAAKALPGSAHVFHDANLVHRVPTFDTLTACSGIETVERLGGLRLRDLAALQASLAGRPIPANEEDAPVEGEESDLPEIPLRQSA